MIILNYAALLFQVRGHYLLPSEQDLDQYDASESSESILRYRDILSKDNHPCVVPREHMHVALQHGALSFRLSPDFIIEIERALDCPDYLEVEPPSSDEEPDPDQPDSEALQRHTETMRAESRLEFTGMVERDRRTRGRTESRMQEYLFF